MERLVAADTSAVSDFSGTLRVGGAGSQPVPARVAVSEGRLGVRVGDIEVGSWRLEDIAIEIRDTGVDLTAGDDRFEFDLTDTTTFVQALAADRSSTKIQPVERRWPRRLLARTRRRGNVRSIPALAGAVLLAGIVAAALVAPMVVGSIALLIGLCLVSVGYLATTEPSVALRIPFGLAATYLILTGTGMVVIGMVMVLLG